MWPLGLGLGFDALFRLFPSWLGHMIQLAAALFLTQKESKRKTRKISKPSTTCNNHPPPPPS